MMDAFTDIRADDWIDRHLPRPARPFARLARLDRPIGWWLLLFPCWWSLALASRGGPDPVLFLSFWLGAVAMRGAGCTLNDLADRDLDAKVERTRSRPLPSGAVTVRAACLFLVAQLALGALVLFSLNRLAILLGFSVMGLVATYPLMKRVTFWPQLFLGLNFNWGALVGWAAATGTVDLPAIALYVGGIFWTLGYDTIYAHADKADDVAAGVKSTALYFGTLEKPPILMFYGLALAGFGAALSMAHAPALSWGFLAAAGVHLARQVQTWHPDDPADCIATFKSNRTTGFLILAACLCIGL